LLTIGTWQKLLEGWSPNPKFHIDKASANFERLIPAVLAAKQAAAP
jgi:hypothetical protein